MYNKPSEIDFAQDKGTLTHVLIAVGCERFGPDATPSEVLSLRDYCFAGPRLSPVYGRARAQFALTSTAAYFRRFGPTGWKFLGSEVIAGDVAFDLLWTRNGMVFADEVKSGMFGIDLGERRLKAQVDAQADVGRNAWGSSFLGVRPVVMGSKFASKHIEEKHLVRAKS